MHAVCLGCHSLAGARKSSAQWIYPNLALNYKDFFKPTTRASCAISRVKTLERFFFPPPRHWPLAARRPLTEIAGVHLRDMVINYRRALAIWTNCRFGVFRSERHVRCATMSLGGAARDDRALVEFQEYRAHAVTASLSGAALEGAIWGRPLAMKLYKFLAQPQ